MSSTYTKLFSSITESTIWVADNETRLCWICMLAMADKYGRVWGSIPGLANRTRISVEGCRKAIAAFLAPDEDSRTKDLDGRRIIEIDGGWQLVNHEKYRAIRDSDERREQVKLAVRRHRENKKSTSNHSNQCKPDVSAGNHSAEADTESKAKAETDPEADPEQKQKKRKKEKRSISSVADAPTAPVWLAYSERYQDRYGVPPTRNAKVNGMLASFCRRVPADEAPHIAAYYLTHNSAYYVQRGHPVDCLLADAEKIRTEWATNSRVTVTQANQGDRRDAQGQVWKKLIEEAEEAERCKQELN